MLDATPHLLSLFPVTISPFPSILAIMYRRQRKNTLLRRKAKHNISAWVRGCYFFKCWYFTSAEGCAMVVTPMMSTEATGRSVRQRWFEFANSPRWVNECRRLAKGHEWIKKNKLLHILWGYCTSFVDDQFIFFPYQKPTRLAMLSKKITWEQGTASLLIV